MDSVKTKVNIPKHRKPAVVSKTAHASYGHHITTPDNARLPQHPGGGVASHSIPKRGGTTKRYGKK